MGKSGRIRQNSEASSASIPAAGRSSTHLSHHAAADRDIVLVCGRTSFNLFQLSPLGHSDAQDIFAAFIDYACAECSHLHRLLHQAVKHFFGWLAVVIIRVPLNERYNPTDQEYACNYARLAWRVWSVGRLAYTAWDGRFICKTGENQSFSLVPIKAKEFADIGCFRSNEPNALTDPLIAAGIEPYVAARKPGVPADVLREAMLQAQVTDLEELIKII